MQPYQQASEEQINQRGRQAQAIGSIAGLGLKGAIGGRVMSMLNKYVPTSLAVKGLNKIDPRLGKFVSLGQESGHSMEDLTQFISGKVQSAETNEPTNQEKNIIQLESPELHTFIDQEIRGGRKPIEAAAIAQNDKRFASIIKKLEKSHKTPWSQIIQGIYGTGDVAPPEQKQAQQQQSPQNVQGGPGQQALMGILAQINQKLGQ